MTIPVASGIREQIYHRSGLLMQELGTLLSVYERDSLITSVRLLEQNIGVTVPNLVVGCRMAIH